MTNAEILLRALNGEELNPEATFHPQNNEQAYLAYAVGLLTDPATLPAPQTIEQFLLKQVCLNGSSGGDGSDNGGSGGGGTSFPQLINAAIAADIRRGKEAINQDGEVLVGECDIDALEAEIARLETLLNNVEDGGMIEELKAIISREGGTTLTIPDVPLIGEYALYKTDFTGVTIPEGVESIGQYAFSNMPNLTAIVIPKTVTSIGANAFVGCGELRDIQIDGPATIGDTAFYSSVGKYIDSLSAPKAVSVGVSAFNGVYMRFETLELPCVETIGENGFRTYAYSGNLKNVILPAVKTIGARAFDGNRLESISMPVVETIGSEAFNWAKYLKHVDLGDKLVSIGANAFEVTAIEEITLPDSLQTIGKGAFNDTPIAEITIPENVTSMGESPFPTDSLIKITYNAINATNAAKYLGAPNVTTFIIGDKVKVLPRYLCANTKITSVSLPATLEEIGAYAFSTCPGLTILYIPESVTKIGDYAFQKCTGLSEITIHENVTSLGKFLCTGCTGITKVIYKAVSATNSHGSRILDATALTQLTIGSNVKSIVPSLAYNCTSLEKVDIPANVESIGDSCFGSCSSLNTVIIRGERVASLLGSNAFKSTPIASGTGYIYVPSAVLDDYKAATNWATHAARFRAIEDYPEVTA